MSDTADDGPGRAAVAPLSPLAAALHRTVLAHPTAKVGLPVLRRAARAADLSFAGSPAARRQLAQALAELEAAGHVRQPKSRTLWERHALPALPTYVQRTRTLLAPPRSPSDLGPAPVWHALLGWAPTFLATGRPTGTETRLLHAAQALLARTGVPPATTVPLRERSLELLDDEKALDSLLRGRLFGPGRLDLALLGARRVVPTLVEARAGEGPDTLLVENYATFDSLAHALAGHRSVGRVIWGAGNQVTQLLPQLPSSTTGKIWYFGDLDVRGLEIGAAATADAVTLGLPPVAPSEDLYALLLEHGRRAPVSGRAPTAGRVEEAVRWLPVTLQRRAAELLVAGLRLAQEAVGADLLTRLPISDLLR